jgi:hypothetical protein
MVSDMRALLAWCVALFFTLCAGCAYAQDRPRSLDELLERARQQREQSGLPTPSTPITAGWPAPQTPQIQQTPQKTIVQGEIGGRIDHHWSRFRDIYNSGANVEVHGKCQSACTLITNMPKSRMCFAEGSRLGFHWAREKVWDGPPSRESTEWMIDHYPPDIRAWLDAQGGIEKMPKDGFWIMPAFILWGMGYRRCEP